MESLHRIATLIKKDVLLEIRQQYTLYGILLYVASTIFVLYLAMESPEEKIWNGLFWMIQLFVCVNAVAKSFLNESRQRMLYFYSITSASSFVLSKLIYNTALMIVMSLISLALFGFFFDNPITHPMRFVGIVCIGGASLSIVFTFLAAIAARAQQNAAMMAILGFPLIIPQLMVLIKLSNTAFSDVIQAGFTQMLLLLCGLDALIILLAIILFTYLWKD